ncbi:hypothetical protein ACTUVN_001013 [Pseudomonas caspiana]
MSLFDIFKGKPKSVQLCGIEFPTMPRQRDELEKLTNEIARHVGQTPNDEQDIYNYVLDQHEQVKYFKTDVSIALANLPFEIYPLEVAARKAEIANFSHPNPGLVYINKIVKPDLLKHYPPQLVELMIATVYVVYCNAMDHRIEYLRVKNANKHRDNCIARGDSNTAAKWAKVINALRPETITEEPSKIVLCGVELEKMPDTKEEQLRMMALAAIGLMQQMPTEQDVYWFVIEQYDRIKSCGELVAAIMATYPFKMFEIEYLDRKSENSYVGHKNPGIVYVLNHILPDLVTHYGPVNAQTMLAFIFGTYLKGHAADIQSLRLKYAVRYHNNCVSTGSWSYADQWSEVIESLDK